MTWKKQKFRGNYNEDFRWCHKWNTFTLCLSNTEIQPVPGIDIWWYFLALLNSFTDTACIPEFTLWNCRNVTCRSEKPIIKENFTLGELMHAYKRLLIILKILDQRLWCNYPLKCLYICKHECALPGCRLPNGARPKVTQLHGPEPAWPWQIT